MTDAQTVRERRGSLHIIERQPPCEIEAERATLGCILLNPDAVTRVTNVLHDHTDVFYVPAHRHIYAACLDLVKSCTPIDEITLTAQLRKNEKLEQVGGAAYVAELTTVVPTSYHAEHYASIVLEAARKRRFIEKSRRLSIAAQEMSPDEYRRFLADLDLEEDYDSSEAETSDILHAPDPPPSLWMRGPAPATFALIAGEGDTSKSYLMLSIAVSLSTGHDTIPAFKTNTPGPVVFLAYEDTPATMLFRLRAITAAADIPFSAVEEALVSRRLTFICNPPGPLFMREKVGTGPTAFFYAFESIIRDTKPVLTIIDPLSGAARLKSENDNAEMGDIGQHLIDLAVRNNTTVLLLHHANKGKTDGKMPTIHSVRGATGLATKTRWTALMYRTNTEDQIVVDIAKNNLYGLHAKIILARGPDGALIPSSATIPSELSGTRTTSKVILRGATVNTETEKGINLTVWIGFPDSGDEIQRAVWFPKTCVDKDGDCWRARPAFIATKEKEIAAAIGVNACKIVVGEGEISKAPEIKPEQEDQSEQEEIPF